MNQQLGDLLITFFIRWILGWIFSTIKYSNLFINKPSLNRILFISKKSAPFYAIAWQFINYTFFIFSSINIYIHIMPYNEMLYIYVKASNYGVIVFGIVAIIDGISYDYRN